MTKNSAPSSINFEQPTQDDQSEKRIDVCRERLLSAIKSGIWDEKAELACKNLVEALCSAGMRSDEIVKELVQIGLSEEGAWSSIGIKPPTMARGPGRAGRINNLIVKWALLAGVVYIIVSPAVEMIFGGLRTGSYGLAVILIPVVIAILFLFSSRMMRQGHTWNAMEKLAGSVLGACVLVRLVDHVHLIDTIRSGNYYILCGQLLGVTVFLFLVFRWPFRRKS